jgi:hypothetical protein
MKKSLLILLFTCLFVQNSWAQDPSNVIKTDTLGKSKNYQFLAIPIVFYTPETSFGFGGGAQVFLLKKKNEFNKRVSNIFFDMIFTSEKQFIIDVLPQIYFGKGNYYLDMSYKYKIFPNNFWGIGNNTPNSNEEPYDMTSQLINISFLKRLPPNLNFGFEVFYQNYDVTKVEEGGMLASGDIVGSDGAIVSGFGVTFNLDTRDNISSPFSGHLLKINAKFSSELFGATQGFNTYIADLRTYNKLGKRSIIALQFYYMGNYGILPFQAMAAYGGGTTARGYYQGRYIDNNMYVAQAEYRYRFVPRWELAAFGLFGEVAATSKELFNFSGMKPSTGGGIRFKILKDQDTWVRADVGIGIDGSHGFSFGINEAF